MSATICLSLPGRLYGTTLREELAARGITKLVLAGIQTELCVDTTCRHVCSLNYDVTLVADAHSTWDRESLSAARIIAHHNSLLGGWFATIKLASEVTCDEEAAPVA